ncbi:hypothetical protein ACRCHC_20995 [Enterobacter hormaechei]|uniref:hypothetical protein n=1 Tax=Enterobacter hormaechei TaxID=158836 RepID=UPI0015D4BD53|nr:hypothetical protein [Enterobacter hormaechei]
MLKKLGCICGWHSKQEIEILYLDVAFRIAAWGLSAVTISGITVRRAAWKTQIILFLSRHKLTAALSAERTFLYKA